VRSKEGWQRPSRSLTRTLSPRLTTSAVPLPDDTNDATLPLVPPLAAFEPRDGSTPREIAIREAPCARSPVDNGQATEAEGSHGGAGYRCLVRGASGYRDEGERLTRDPHLVSSRRATLTVQSESACRAHVSLLTLRADTSASATRDELGSLG
jgi:hypothetical protein